MGRSLVEVVHVGSAAATSPPMTRADGVSGGGVTYAALTTARLGLTTAAVIGVDDAAARADELDQPAGRRRGRPPRAARRGPGLPQRRDASRAATDLSRRRAGRSGRWRSPESWRERRAWSFTPVADEMPDAWRTRRPPGHRRRRLAGDAAATDGGRAGGACSAGRARARPAGRPRRGQSPRCGAATSLEALASSSTRAPACS